MDRRSHPSDFGYRGRFSQDEEDRRFHAGSTGILESLPHAVASPLDARDLQALVRWAATTATPLIPRGAATGMPGGNVGPGVAIDMVENFDPAPAIDPAARVARVGPGTTLSRLNLAAERHHLHFPVDPSSGARCTLGGMIANNSAGAHSVKYGSMRAWVRSLELVLADGNAATLTRGSPPPPSFAPLAAQLDASLTPAASSVLAHWPRVRKNSSGYAVREYLDSRDPIDLVIGSEGTLAIVTGATLDLTEPPGAVGLLLLEFDSVAAATDAVQRLLPLEPLTCEMLDRTFLDLVRSADADVGYPLHDEIEALLLVEISAASPGELPSAIDEGRLRVEPFARRIIAESDPRRVQEMWEIRHAASPIIARQAGRRVSMQFIEDSVVPVEHLSDYVLGLRAILRQHDLPAVIFGHAGDGNLHVNPLVDVHAAEWHQTLEAVLSEVAELVVRLGGTLSGEHGDGRLRAPLLSTVWPKAAISAFRNVKETFDPKGILNPGVILPLPGQKPFDHLRKFA